jgi:hypothetical protein
MHSEMCGIGTASSIVSLVIKPYICSVTDVFSIFVWLGASSLIRGGGYLLKVGNNGDSDSGMSGNEPRQTQQEQEMN